jgi:DNA-directed RNA polymerase subunit RPC12/RpoP
MNMPLEITLGEFSFIDGIPRCLRCSRILSPDTPVELLGDTLSAQCESCGSITAFKSAAGDTWRIKADAS